MKRWFLAILLAVVLAVAITGSTRLIQDLDGPAAPIGETVPSGLPNNFHFHSASPTLLADGLAAPIPTCDPISIS
jgi:hypothetical protein